MSKTKKSERCNFDSRPMSFAAREVGCPLDHCPCGTHDVEHDCRFDETEHEHDDYYGGP